MRSVRTFMYSQSYTQNVNAMQRTEGETTLQPGGRSDRATGSCSRTSVVANTRHLIRKLRYDTPGACWCWSEFEAFPE